MACTGDHQHQPWCSRHVIYLSFSFDLLNKLTGIIPWIDPTPNDIKQAASRLALVLPRMTRFLFTPNTIFARQVTPALDIASWSIGSEVLWLATNLSNDTVGGVTLPVSAEGITGRPLPYQWLLSENAVITPDGVLVLGPFGSSILVSSKLHLVAQPQSTEHDEL